MNKVGSWIVDARDTCQTQSLHFYTSKDMEVSR